MSVFFSFKLPVVRRARTRPAASLGLAQPYRPAASATSLARSWAVLALAACALATLALAACALAGWCGTAVAAPPGAAGTLPPFGSNPTAGESALVVPPDATYLEDEAEPSCNIAFTLPAPPVAGRFTLLFDQRDRANFYSLECSANGVAVYSTQSGARRLLASATVAWRGQNSLTLQRRPWMMRLVMNGNVALTAYDAAFNSGKVGALNSAWKWGEPRLQPVEPIHFDDDFTRAGTEGDADWKPSGGKWRLSASSERISATNAQMSSNPFAYEVGPGANPGGAFAWDGRWFWDNYDARVAVRPMGRGTIGIAAYVQDAKNYLAFLWSSEEGPGARRLVRVQNGKTTLLASGSGAYFPRQWYQLGLRTSPGYVEAILDGAPALRTADDAFGQGGVGLVAEGCVTAFDDVQVRSYDFFRQDFRSTGGTWTPAQGGAWTADGGSWTATGGLLTSAATKNEAARGRFLLAGRPDWDGYQLIVTASGGPAAVAGLVTGYRDAANYTLFRWAGTASSAPYKGRQQLVRCVNGTLSVLSDEPLRLGRLADARGNVRLSARFDSGAVAVYAGGDMVAQSGDESGVPGGRPALWSQGPGAANFSDVVILFPPPPERQRVVQRMEDDPYMVGWASATGEWPPTPGDHGIEFWNTGQFFGDATMEFFWRAAWRGNLDVALRAERGKFESGYVLRGEPTEDHLGVHWTISRGGKVLKSAATRLTDLPGAASEDGAPMKLALRGRGVLLSCGGKPVVGILEADAPGGSGLAVRSSGFRVRADHLTATSANRDDYTFTDAPTDFYSPQGTWSVFSRWPCYGDWSFFGGTGQNPVLWTKRSYAGDVVVEMYVHNQMDLPKEVGYSHPGDFDISLAADGKNPATGYSFVVGGWDDTRAKILRGSAVVAEGDGPGSHFEKTINHNMRWHRRWVYVRAEARQAVSNGHPGVQLTLTVDDNPVASYFDPDPLKLVTQGGRVAFWTADGTLMIARAKIESSHPGGRALPAGLVDALADSPAGAAPPAATSGFSPRPVVSDGLPTSVVSALKTATGTQWRVQNPAAGGLFAVAMTNKPLKVDAGSRLSMRMLLPPEVHVDIYLNLGEELYLVDLAGNQPADAAAPSLGKAELGSAAADLWRDVSFDLGGALAKRFPEQHSWTLDQVTIGAMHGDVYRYVGFFGNSLGAAYRMADFAISPGSS